MHKWHRTILFEFVFLYIIRAGRLRPLSYHCDNSAKDQKLVLLADLAVPRPIRANISYSKKKVACEGGLAVNGCILVITFSHFSHFSSHFTRRKVVAQTWCVCVLCNTEGVGHLARWRGFAYLLHNVKYKNVALSHNSLTEENGLKDNIQPVLEKCLHWSRVLNDSLT